MAANNHIGSLSKQYNLSLLYPVPLDGWNKSDTLVYTLPNSIPAGNYEAEIGIRYQESYPYRDKMCIRDSLCPLTKQFS